MRTRRVVAAAFGLMVALILLVPGVAPARAAEAESLLLPGIDMRSVEFTVGAWCRYLVVDEAMGDADSSTVYLAVVGREESPTGNAFWLEIESGPFGAPPAERDVARALVDERVRSMAEGDSLYRYIPRFYVRKGNGPVEAGDPRDLRRLTIISPAAETDWKLEPEGILSTPAGELACQRRHFERNESREVPRGRFTLTLRRSDRVQVWIAPAIPIFHLARCEIDRTRESRTVPPVKGIPDSGPKQSRTTSVIVERGTGAKALVSIP